MIKQAYMIINKDERERERVQGGMGRWEHLHGRMNQLKRKWFYSKERKKQQRKRKKLVNVNERNKFPLPWDVPHRVNRNWRLTEFLELVLQNSRQSNSLWKTSPLTTQQNWLKLDGTYVADQSLRRISLLVQWVTFWHHSPNFPHLFHTRSPKTRRRDSRRDGSVRAPAR